MVDQCQLDMPFYEARQLGSTATTLLLLFYSKSDVLCGSKLIFCTSFVFCFAFRMGCHFRKKNSIQIFRLNFVEKFTTVGLKKQKKCTVAGMSRSLWGSLWFSKLQTWRNILLSNLERKTIYVRNSYVMKNIYVFYIFSSNWVGLRQFCGGRKGRRTQK